MKLRLFITSITILTVAICSFSQNYSTDVKLKSLDGNIATLISTATAEKKKNAEQMALQSAFHTLLTSGVEGLKNGMPMVTELRSDYQYRLFNENRYINFIVGKPETLNKSKISNLHRYTLQVSINLKTLIAELERNNMMLSPAWLDRKKIEATSSLNPMIVIVPYVDASSGYSFDAMRTQFESDNLKRFVIDKVAGAFQKRGYKTYDFINILQDSQLNDILRQGSQTDDATMVVQQLPGDIIVTAEVDVHTYGRSSELSLHIRAIEKQTSGRLATQSFSSGQFYTNDTHMLATYAIDKMQDDFFSQLSTAFDTMVRKGREVSIDLNLSESVSDWDFEQDSPVTGNYFKDELEEWLRTNSMRQVYNMNRSTDKYVKITLNVPLWDMEKNRPFTLSNFNSHLRRFFRQQLGEMYKANITYMGQKIVVIIE